MDLLEAFSLIQEPVTGIPTGTVIRYFKYTTKPEKTKSINNIFGGGSTKSINDIFGNNSSKKSKTIEDIFKP